MKYNKYIKDNNIIHIVDINDIDEIKKIITNNDILDSIYKYNDFFINDFLLKYCKLNKVNININLRYQKEYKEYGKNPIINRVITQNINSYKIKTNTNIINIYYDLTNKYNSDNNIILNRFIVTYYLVKKLKKYGYKINFIPVLFLKAFDNIDNNEYIYIKFSNLSIDTIKKYNLITNDKVSRILLPEIIKSLEIKNKEALDYNGYLLEKQEKEYIIGLNNSDILIDMFTSDNLFNGDIEHDSEIFYKSLTLK